MDVTGTRKAMIEALVGKSPEPGAAIQAFRQLDPDAGDRGILRVLFGPAWIWGLAAKDLPDIAHDLLDLDASLHIFWQRWRPSLPMGWIGRRRCTGC